MSFLRQLRGKNGRVDTELMSKIRKEVEARYSRTVHATEFILPKEVPAILTRDRVLDLFKKLSWYSEHDRDVLWPRMCSIICILITINFDIWDEFKSIFFIINQSGRSRPRFIDDNLPIRDVSWLPTQFQTDFLRQQYTFMPVIFEKDTHREYDVYQRLPIIEEKPISGRGAQGTVDKVYIEKGYLQTSHNIHNSEVQVMARKRFKSGIQRSQQSFSTERHILEQFRKSQTSHQNIMQSFATFLHGPDLVILSDWAEWGDLRQFLEEPDQVVDDYPLHSARFTPHNLLTEAASLAEALEYLHYHMGNKRGAKFQFAHLDLKPENVLVFMPSSSNPADTPVGQWKITDFGLSNVEISITRGGSIVAEPTTGSGGFLAPGRLLGEHSWRPLKRGAGPYQPPEVRDADIAKVSTERDVWSFGCILAMVLAFAIGGPEEVYNQRRYRSDGTDDFFYMRISEELSTGPLDPRSTGWVDAQLKPEIRSWLTEYAPSRAPPNHSEWIFRWARLVLSLLEVNVKKRPGIQQAVRGIHELLNRTEQASYRLWDFERSALAPELQSVVPEMQVTSDVDSVHSLGPYIGIRTNSSGSSAPPSRSSPNRSTLSIGSSHRSDHWSRYIRMETVSQGRSANMCPSGSSVAFWSSTEYCIYDLSAISDDDPLWQQKARGQANLNDNRMPYSVYRSTIRGGSLCQKIALNGSFMALLLSTQPSTYTIIVYRRAQVAHTERMTFERHVEKTLPSVPDDFKLSARGSCLVRLPNELYFITLHGSVGIPVPSYVDVMGYDFTSDGRFFCTWVTWQGYHYWDVRDYKGSLLGTEQIQHKWTPKTDGRHTREAYLLPFHAYPRFIACDKHGNIFLIRADADVEQAQRLGRTENVYAGMMLPDDGAFLIIRQTQHEHQKLQRTNLTLTNNVVHATSYECGKLSEYMDKSTSGVCVRINGGTEGGLCVLIVLRNGLLIRKILRQ